MENINNERRDPINETFKEFYRKQEEILNIIDGFKIQTNGTYKLNKNLFLRHYNIGNIDEEITINWYFPDINAQEIEFISLRKFIYYSEINTNLNFESHFQLGMGVLTDSEALEMIDKLDENEKIKDKPITYFLFNEKGERKKIIAVNKSLGYLKYFPNWENQVVQDYGFYVMLEKDFNGGDLELIDYSLTMLKGKLISTS